MKYFGIAYFFLLSFAAQAQQPVEIDDAITERNFFLKELTYYIDETNSITFSQATSTGFSNRYRQHESYQNKDFKTNASYWIRFPVRHNASSKKIWLFEFYDQTIDYIEAYIPQEDGSYRGLVMGDTQPFDKRTFLHKNFEIPLVESDSLTPKTFGQTL